MITAAIATVTLLLILMKPRRLSEGAIALAGAAVMIASARLSVDAVRGTMQEISGVVAFLSGLFWLTLACDRAGVFERAAEVAVRLSRGNSYRLLFAVFALGTATTTFLSNDATVVLVTPVILLVCRQHGLPPLPFLFACTFVADSASSMLPVSNPINLIFAERFDISLLNHASYMVVPTILGVLVSLLAFHLLFRASIPRSFSRVTPPVSRSALAGVDRIIIGGLAVVVLGYIASSPLGISPYWVTLVGGLVLALIAAAGQRVKPVELAHVQPPSLYAFVIGLALLVSAVDSAGLLTSLGSAVVWAGNTGTFTGLLAVTFGTALGTNLVNNWTMALAVVPALEDGGASNLLVLGAMLGADVGPNLTVVGSLATLIWLTQVRNAGLAVSARTYLKIGAIVTLPATFVSTLALYAIHLFAN